MVNSRYELTLIEEGFDKDGKLEHRRETKYNPDEVRKLRMGLDQDIVNFFEEQEDEHLFFTHLYNAAMREYTTPKFEVQPVTYECPKCGFEDLPDDVVPCPNCK